MKRRSPAGGQQDIIPPTRTRASGSRPLQGAGKELMASRHHQRATAVAKPSATYQQQQQQQQHRQQPRQRNAAASVSEQSTKSKGKSRKHRRRDPSSATSLKDNIIAMNLRPAWNTGSSGGGGGGGGYRMSKGTIGYKSNGSIASRLVGM